MDITTIDDVLKQKKQELKNVKRLILNSHNYVAKLLHKKFVENNGCKVCHGTGRLYDHNANANNFSGSCSCLRCSCLQETREKSGVDPYNGFEKHVFYQENVYSIHPDDYSINIYPVISSDLFKTLIHGLRERVSELRNEIQLLSARNKYEKFNTSLVVVTNPKGAFNFYWKPFFTESKRIVESGTVLRLSFKCIWHHPWRGHKTKTVLGWDVNTLDDERKTYFLQQKDFRKLYNQEQTW